MEDKTKLDSESMSELEKAKDEILKRIAEKVKANASRTEEFGAAHSSHSSSSKHSSSTS
jgi:hypothetical protein